MEKLNIKIIIIACLTLGLSPYLPEPHIWGKIKWVAGGAHGMGWVDWFDLIFHGIPFLLLFYWIFIRLFKKK